MNSSASVTRRCRRHPRQMVVGVCAVCLKERLLALMMEEVELEKSARDSFAPEVFPSHNHSMGFTQEVYSTPSFNLLTDDDHSSAGSAVLIRRHGMEYNTEDVKHVASLFPPKNHSLTSSPLLQPSTIFPLPSDDQKNRKKSYFDSKSSYFDSTRSFFTFSKAENLVKTPRKKRTSLWSLIQRHADESDSTMRKHCSKPEQHRRSVGSSSYRAHKDGVCRDAHHELSYSTTSLIREEVHNSIRKGNASSLLSSPISSSKPAGASSHMPSPASSKHCTPYSPRRSEKSVDEKKLARGRQLYSLGSMHHSFDDGRRHHNSSWISSLFPRKGRRSKSISATTGAHAYVAHSCRWRAVDASPEIAPRRKSVSFLDDRGSGFKSPHNSTGPRSVDIRSPNHLFNHSIYENFLGLEGRHEANDVNDGRRVHHSDGIELKSSRMKLTNLLTKRRSSVSIDCSRDMRVSPAPILLSAADDGCQDHVNNHLLRHEKYHNNHESYHGFYTNGSRIKPKQRAPLVSSPSNAANFPVFGEPQEGVKSFSNISRSKSWSAAWNKTLSPLMLGLTSKKKKGNSNGRIKQSMDNYPTNHHGYGVQASLPPRQLQSKDFLVPVLSPDTVLPEHNRPPQHYSFLSKDYSAFSFYFSPRHQQSPLINNNHDYTDYNKGSDGEFSRHTVDGAHLQQLQV